MGREVPTIEDAGEPRLVAGISDVEWTEVDGSNGIAVGGFAAGKGRVRTDLPCYRQRAQLTIARRKSSLERRTFGQANDRAVR